MPPLLRFRTLDRSGARLSRSGPASARNARCKKFTRWMPQRSMARSVQGAVLPESNLSRAAEGTSRRRPILMVGISFRFAAS